MPAPPATPTKRASGQTTGLHLLGDLQGCGCAPELMLDAARLQAMCQHLVAQAGLTAVGSLFHRFADGGGVTGMVVLAESHVAIHTWPEAAYVTLDVFVCNYSTDNRPKAQWLFDALCQAFAPTCVQAQTVVRG